MGTQDPNERRKLRLGLKAALRRLVGSTYLVLFVLLIGIILAAGLNIEHSPWTFSFQRIVETVRGELVAVVAVSILITVIYDFFVKKKEAQIRDLERDELIDRIAGNALLAHGAAKLSEAQASEIIEPLLHNPDFLHALARHTARSDPSRSDERAKNLTKSYFNPLWIDTPLVYFKKWNNRLRPAPGQPDNYHWESFQTFTLYEKTDVHRVAITDDGDVADDLINSGVYFNNVVVIAKDSQAQLDTLLATFKLKMSNLDVRGQPISFKPKTPEDVWGKRNVPPTLAGLGPKLRILEFKIDSPHEQNSFDFEFTVPCSLDEPFLYIVAERICFIEAIEINYADLKSQLAKVWSMSFIVNESCKMRHRKEDFIAECEVNGLIMGGHGISLNWTRAGASAS